MEHSTGPSPLRFALWRRDGGRFRSSSVLYQGMKLNPFPPSRFHVVVCVGVYWRTASNRTNCTRPDEGVNTGTAQPGCCDEVMRTRFSHASTNLTWLKQCVETAQKRMTANNLGTLTSGEE